MTTADKTFSKMCRG